MYFDKGRQEETEYTRDERPLSALVVVVAIVADVFFELVCDEALIARNSKLGKEEPFQKTKPDNHSLQSRTYLAASMRWRWRSWDQPGNSIQLPDRHG